MKTVSYEKNIKLEYLHTLFRNLNVTQGIWLVFLASRGFIIFEVALFEGIFHITSLLMEIPTGAIGDVFGRKTSRILGVLSYFIFIAIILNFNSFLLVGIGFIFCGLSYVFESGSAEALVYDSLVSSHDEDKFMKVMGVKEVIYQTSGFIALIASGIIAKQNPEFNFYLTGIFFIFALIMIVNMREVPVEKKHKKTLVNQFKNQFVISTKTVVRNKRLFLLIVIGALMSAPITTIFFFFQNYFDYHEIPIEIFTIYLGLHAGASAIGGYYAHSLEKKFGEKKMLFFIPLLISIMFWVILIDTVMVIPFILLGALDSVFYIILIDYMNKIVESQERATVLSFFGMAFSIVMIVVFTLIGFVIQIKSFAFAFMILAIIVTLFYVVLLFVLKGNHLENKE